jgi:hypothetical protein
VILRFFYVFFGGGAFTIGQAAQRAPQKKGTLALLALVHGCLGWRLAQPQPRSSVLSKGRPNNKHRGSPWWEAKKGPGSNIFAIYFYFIVFSKSPRRETPTHVINKNRENIGFDLLSIFL